MLALQIDLSMANVEVEMDEEVLTLLIHIVSGMVFMFDRDLSYLDPSFGDGTV